MTQGWTDRHVSRRFEDTIAWSDEPAGRRPPAAVPPPRRLRRRGRPRCRRRRDWAGRRGRRSAGTCGRARGRQPGGRHGGAGGRAPDRSARDHRDYAQDGLEETGELHDVRRAHAHHYLGVAHDLLSDELARPEEVLLGRRTLEPELDNFREALTWALRSDRSATQSALGLALCAPLAGCGPGPATSPGGALAGARGRRAAMRTAPSPRPAFSLRLAVTSTGKRDRDYHLRPGVCRCGGALVTRKVSGSRWPRLAVQLQSIGDPPTGCDAAQGPGLARESGAGHQLATRGDPSTLEALVPTRSARASDPAPPTRLPPRPRTNWLAGLPEDPRVCLCGRWGARRRRGQARGSEPGTLNRQPNSLTVLG